MPEQKKIQLSNVPIIPLYFFKEYSADLQLSKYFKALLVEIFLLSNYATNYTDGLPPLFYELISV